MLIKTIKLWDDREDVELTTFVSLPEENMPPKKRPAIIVCPGGAYQVCPRHGHEGDNIAMSFAADGYQAFVLEYSVATKAPEGKALFPAQLIDFGKAMLTVREHADEWDLDPEKISIAGFSAGGHLCGMLATTWHEALLAGHFNVDAEMFRPLSAILVYPLIDFVLQRDFENNEILGDVNSPIFGCADPDEETRKQNSPVYLVSEKTCPMFISAAIDDGLLPAEHSLNLASALQKNKVPYELHMFEYGDHGFSTGLNFYQPSNEDKKRGAAQWLPLAKTFLNHRVFGMPEHEKSPFLDFMNSDKDNQPS